MYVLYKMEEYDEEYVPEPPKLRRGRAKAVSVDPEPEIQPIPARPRSRAKKADPEPEELPPAPEPKPKRTRAKPPEPREPEWTEVKPKRARKKPEPGSVPPRDVSFTSARGPISTVAFPALSLAVRAPPRPPCQ